MNSREFFQIKKSSSSEEDFFNYKLDFICSIDCSSLPRLCSLDLTVQIWQHIL